MRINGTKRQKQSAPFLRHIICATQQVMRAFTLNQVLFATDFSPASEAAFRYAAALAERFSARLYVLHVVPETEGAEAGARAPKARHRHAGYPNSSAMLKLRDALLAGNEECIVATITGDPSRRIVEKARQLNVDVIVLGVHHGAPAPLTRDVVQEVCATSPCPVVCVPVLAQTGRDESHAWE